MLDSSIVTLISIDRLSHHADHPVRSPVRTFTHHLSDHCCLGWP